LGGMDALTAAASAVAMGIDENPDEDEGLGSSRATATGHENTMPVNADICADEEGDDEAPAVHDAQATDPKVSKAMRVLRNMPRAPPIGLFAGHTDMCSSARLTGCSRSAAAGGERNWLMRQHAVRH
jgi:hypothetical protein